MPQLIIIGSGSAGVSAAEAAREAGAMDVVVVESAQRLGGECPNRGCVPTKSLLRSVEVLSLARRAAEFGVRAGKVEADLPAMMARKRGIVDALTGNGRIEKLLESIGVELIRGRAAFTGRNAIEVAGTRHTADRFVVATGSETSVPPIEGLEASGYMTSDDLVELERLPASVLIIGGGPIGVESAQILAPLGVKVTVVEYERQILAREEAEIAAVVTASFARQGITILTGMKTVRVARNAKGRVVTLEPSGGGQEMTLEAEAVMVAAGKRPAVGGLGLEAAGVEFDQRGVPKLNDFLQTSNPAVYVAGDASGRMLFTHVAHEQGRIAATNAVKGNVLMSDLSVIPRGTFCSPEVGSVGLTEQEARDRGYDVGVGKAEYSYFGKALVTGEDQGLIKIVVDKKSKKVLGGHVVGQAAAELVHELALAMFAGIPYTAIAEMVHAYPTYSEGIGAAAYAVI